MAGVPPAGSRTPKAPLSAADLRGRFVGRRVVVEPLAAAHEAGLMEAAVDAEMFRWMPVDMASSRDALREWVATTLAAAEAGSEVPYTILDANSGGVLGSTRFLDLRLEHLRAEIGWTWVTRGAWGSGVNVETKLLLLGHAFERAGLRRVEFKTDARNALRSEGRCRRWARSSRGSSASTWWCATEAHATPPTTR